METKSIQNDIKKDVLEHLEGSIEGFFFYFHNKYKTTSGDIAPDQLAKLDQLKNELAELMATQIYQNL
jgi:hypothetical protein